MFVWCCDGVLLELELELEMEEYQLLLPSNQFSHDGTQQNVRTTNVKGVIEVV